MDFPEPVQWNGGPDDRPFFSRSKRTREEAPREVAHPACAWCAAECRQGYVSLAGVGVFCSHRHKDAYLETRDRKRTA